MKVLAFGELLFDRYPSASKIGGAPFNFAAHLAQLGADSYLLGAVGEDALGKEAKETAESLGVNTRWLQVCTDSPTGVCQVSYKNEEPVYDLSQLSAYDRIIYPENFSREAFDVLYYGTLACRSETSRKTLKKLRQSGQFVTLFFDMNLRQNYYSEELVKEGLRDAHMVKMNREEFAYVKEIALLPPADPEAALQAIRRSYDISTLILTLDREGAIVCDKEEGILRMPCKKSPFVSAVGAGDSFCACFLYHYKKGASLKNAMEKATLLASYVVSREEAIPLYPEELKEKLR